MDECHLDFVTQCKIVARGIKRGFKYDGCTAVPDFDFGSDCCGEHDYHYQSQRITRAQADERLRQCILKKGYPFVANAYYAGLRIVGWFWWLRRKRSNKNGTVGIATEDGPI